MRDLLTRNAAFPVSKQRAPSCRDMLCCTQSPAGAKVDANTGANLGVKMQEAWSTVFCYAPQAVEPHTI